MFRTFFTAICASMVVMMCLAVWVYAERVTAYSTSSTQRVNTMNLYQGLFRRCVLIRNGESFSLLLFLRIATTKPSLNTFFLSTRKKRSRRGIAGKKTSRHSSQDLIVIGPPLRHLSEM